MTEPSLFDVAEPIVVVRDSTPLRQVREWLIERRDQGEQCPCCGQFAKVYRRKIHSTMARDLTQLWRAASYEWTHVPTALGSHGRSVGDLAKMAYWGLMEEMPAVREDGSSRSGWWRITNSGGKYVRGELYVSKYALVYDGKVLSLEGEQVGIRDALGTKFNYDDLMRGL